MVQLGALKNAAKVNEIVAQLRLSGYRAFTVPSTPVQGQITHLRRAGCVQSETAGRTRRAERHLRPRRCCEAVQHADQLISRADSRNRRGFWRSEAFLKIYGISAG